MPCPATIVTHPGIWNWPVRVGIFTYRNIDRHCRPYQVPSGTIRYSPSIFSCFVINWPVNYKDVCRKAPALPGLLTSRYCPISSCTVYLVLCTLCRQVSLVIGLIRPLPTAIRGKVGYSCACRSLFGDRSWVSKRVALSGIINVMCYQVFPRNDRLEQLIQGLF